MSRREKPMAIPLFVDSYLTGTMMLDAEQDGCNLRLMMAAWRQPDCGLPHDDKQLANIVRMPLARWRKISGPVLALWTAENGRLFQGRLRREWEYVNGKRAQARSAVAAREVQKRIGKTSDDASDDVSADVSTLVEVRGRGEGSTLPSHYQEEGWEGDSLTRMQAREAGPFKVIGGGK
ncbi:MAG: DUF1376 domain-containing protein [Polynucleobacter sp.]